MRFLPSGVLQRRLQTNFQLCTAWSGNCLKAPIVLCRVVEQDIADILLDAWQARATDGGDISQSHHTATAKHLIDSADQQDFGLLERAFASVQDEHDEHTLGDVADRILIYTVQKGWGAAAKVYFPSRLRALLSA